jgi:hypothetical protein
VAREAGWWRYGVASLAMLGWAHALAAVAGVVLLLRRSPRAALLLLCCPMLYLAGMLTKDLFFWRFALPLLPFLAVAAAAAWDDLAQRTSALLRARRNPTRPASVAGVAIAPALMLALASAEPAARLARHDQLLTRESTWLQARAWLPENVPPGARLLIEGYPPRFPGDRFRLWLPYVGLDGLASGDAASPAGGSADDGGWLVTDSFYEQGLRNEPGAERWSVTFDRLRSSMPRMAMFAPGPHGDAQPFVPDSLYSPLVDLWGIDRPGFTISIYRMNPAAWRKVSTR